MEEFKVPLREVGARVLVLGSEPTVGQFHVPATSPGGGPGRLIDRLNDDDVFLPWKHEGRTDLIRKSSIVWVRIGPAEPAEDPGSEGQAHGARVTLTFRGGTPLEGEVHYLMPHDRSRVLDYLNAAPRFVAVRDEHGMLLVNFEFVVSLRQHP